MKTPVLCTHGFWGSKEVLKAPGRSYGPLGTPDCSPHLKAPGGFWLLQNVPAHFSGLLALLPAPGSRLGF